MRSNRRGSRQRDSGPDPANVSGTVSGESAASPQNGIQESRVARRKKVSNVRYKPNWNEMSRYERD
jgi:hypothetical protein